MLDVIIRVIREPLQLDVVCLGAEKALQHRHYFFEIGPVCRFRFPAVVHYVVQLAATVLRLFQPVSSVNLVKERKVCLFYVKKTSDVTFDQFVGSYHV